MGTVNQLGKVSKNLATLTQPLRELLSKKHTWGPNKQQAFAQVKDELTKPTTLALYDLQESRVSADASAYGLGAGLLQKTDSRR